MRMIDIIIKKREGEELTPEEIAHLRYSAEHYIQLKNDYLNNPPEASKI